MCLSESKLLPRMNSCEQKSSGRTPNSPQGHHYQSRGPRSPYQPHNAYYEPRYSPPLKKQLAGGKMHVPPKAEDLPVPPMDWCGLEAARENSECAFASSLLKRMLKVSA